MITTSQEAASFAVGSHKYCIQDMDGNMQGHREAAALEQIWADQDIVDPMPSSRMVAVHRADEVHYHMLGGLQSYARLHWKPLKSRDSDVRGKYRGIHRLWRTCSTLVPSVHLYTFRIYRVSI